MWIWIWCIFSNMLHISLHILFHTRDLGYTSIWPISELQYQLWTPLSCLFSCLSSWNLKYMFIWLRKAVIWHWSFCCLLNSIHAKSLLITNQQKKYLGLEGFCGFNLFKAAFYKALWKLILICTTIYNKIAYSYQWSLHCKFQFRVKVLHHILIQNVLSVSHTHSADKVSPLSYL